MSGRAVVMSTITCCWCRAEPDVEPVGRRVGAVAPPVRPKISSSRTSTPTRARRRAVRRLDRRDLDAGKLVGRAGWAADRVVAVERLEAAGGQAGQRQNGQQDAAKVARFQATTLTILCGTTMTFFGLLAVERLFYRIERQNGSLNLGFSSIAGTVTSARFLPLICTGRVMRVFDQQRRLQLAARPRSPPGSCGRARPSTPRPDAASSGGTAAPGCRRPRARPRRDRAAGAVSRAADGVADSALAHS